MEKGLSGPNAIRTQHDKWRKRCYGARKSIKYRSIACAHGTRGVRPSGSRLLPMVCSQSPMLRVAVPHHLTCPLSGYSSRFLLEAPGRGLARMTGEGSLATMVDDEGAQLTPHGCAERWAPAALICRREHVTHGPGRSGCRANGAANHILPPEHTAHRVLRRYARLCRFPPRTRVCGIGERLECSFRDTRQRVFPAFAPDHALAPIWRRRLAACGLAAGGRLHRLHCLHCSSRLWQSTARGWGLATTAAALLTPSPSSR